MSTIESEKSINTLFKDGTMDVLITDQVSVAGNIVVTEKTRYRIGETVRNCGIW